MINDKLTKELQEQITENKDDITENKKDINKLYDIQYISYTSGTDLKPTFNCYAEIYLSFSGWSYAGQESVVTINNSQGNATQIAKADSGIGGHDTVPDAGMCIAVYKLNANTTYKFAYSGLNGGRIATNMLIKLIPLK